MDPFQIGSLSSRVIDILHLPFEINTPILLGNSNIDHIKKTHPLAFLKYGNRITEIVNTPDYVRINPKDQSIEFVKEYQFNNEYVKVAVRVTTNGKLYARTLFIFTSQLCTKLHQKWTSDQSLNIDLFFLP